MPALVDFVDSYSWALLFGIFVVLSGSALLGKFAGVRTTKKNNPDLEDELKIVLGATLSLFGLLVGFMLSFSMSGYDARIGAEENEAIAIGNAFQRTTLLDERHRDQAKAILTDYLNLRIRFYETLDEDKRETIRFESIGMQAHMWALISKIATQNPNPVLTSALNACNDLYVTQQKTMSSWRHNIPQAAWVVLIVFGIFGNYLIGRTIRNRRGSQSLLLIIPAISALAMFMIAEIDVPGKGIVHVEPDNLKSIHLMVNTTGLAGR